MTQNESRANPKLKIRVISPLCSMTDQMRNDTMAEVEPLSFLGIEFDNVVLGNGPASIENNFDEVMAAPYVAIEAVKAEQQKVDAVVIDCMGDPGLMAAREAVTIPVIGPGEAAMHMAAIMGNRFSCVTILDAVRPIFLSHAKIYGIAEKLASVRSIDMPVLEIEKNMSALPDKLYEQSLQAIEHDNADTIILGCTGFVGVADKLREKLLNQAGYNVPVINPLPNAAMVAAMMVFNHLSHSPRAYKKLNFSKKYIGYDLPEPVFQTGL